MIGSLFKGFDVVIGEVALALGPLLAVFLFFQFFMLKLPRRQVIKIVKGFAMTFVGLSLFLQGVFIGFMPLGESMGMSIGALTYNWILIPIGFLLGFAVIMAEPSVRVLITEVDKVSSGHINGKVLFYTICTGVAFAVALSMIRILCGISIWYFVVPGYLAALVLMRFASDEFVSIAFDAGGAATGPMTVTFILSMAVGAAKQLEGRDPLLDGFGMVSMVALAPILSILALGFLYGRKQKTHE
ncbi:MAG: hypothetical protein A4E73_03072 [Syntrophaceae bacterium PtaU1.Bin231]|nr:MAG: hypothetical protein A4E73_03072 [Syntrophaceae bacterium PtaU1.Bin231]HOG18065.1 DUF1538 domain-containing protein [Syntrophales bacterium]